MLAAGAMTAKRVPMDIGDSIAVDSTGALVVKFEPSDQIGIVLDLEGKLNKLDIHVAHRYALTAGIAAELVADLIVAGQHAAAVGSACEITGGRDFLAEFEAALAHEQLRRGLTP